MFSKRTARGTRSVSYDTHGAHNSLGNTEREGMVWADNQEPQTLQKHLLVFITDTFCNLGQIISSMRCQSWKNNNKSTECQEKDRPLTSLLRFSVSRTTTSPRGTWTQRWKAWHIWDSSTSARNHFHTLSCLFFSFKLSSCLPSPLCNNSEHGNSLDSYWQLIQHQP